MCVRLNSTWLIVFLMIFRERKIMINTNKQHDVIARRQTEEIKMPSSPLRKYSLKEISYMDELARACAAMPSTPLSTPPMTQRAPRPATKTQPVPTHDTENRPYYYPYLSPVMALWNVAIEWRKSHHHFPKVFYIADQCLSEYVRDYAYCNDGEEITVMEVGIPSGSGKEYTPVPVLSDHQLPGKVLRRGEIYASDVII